MRCAVKNCNNHNKSKQCTISFFTFPSDAKLLKEWKSFCGRDKKMNVKTSQICMEHFKPDDFENNLQFEMGFSKKRFLKRGVVPTIHKLSSMDEKRQKILTQRIQRRENKKIVEILIKEYDAESALVKDVNEPPVQDIETKLFMDRQFLQEPVELSEPQKENFLKNNYEQNEIECFEEEMCVGYNIEMENLKEEIERLHKQNSVLKETSKKQTAELKYLMEKRDKVLKMVFK